jgi:hypothetical protein
MLRFEQYEPIEIKTNQAYTLQQIRDLAHRSGFAVEREFTDVACCFVNTVWKAV